MFRLFLIFLLLSTPLFAEESTLKPGAELKIDVSFLPEVLAEFNGEKIYSKDFLPSVAHRLNPLAKQKTSEATISVYIANLIDEKVTRLVSLELASLAGVEPNIGLSYLEMQNMEKEMGRQALVDQLNANGVSYSDGPKYMAESKAIDEWFRTKILAENQINEAEALLYYTENREKFDRKKRVKFAQIFTGYFLEEQMLKARKKITEAHYELSLGKDFSEVAKKYSEGKHAANGGIEERFFTEDELRAELKDVMEMKVGEVSKVIKSSSGFHILKVLEKRPAGIPEFKELRKGLILTMSVERAKAVLSKMVEARKKELGYKVFVGQQ